jgi:hypothetical protein
MVVPVIVAKETGLLDQQVYDGSRTAITAGGDPRS